MENALEGTGLEENGIDLKALSALWGDDLSEGVVYHYGFSGWGGRDVRVVGIVKALSGGYSPDCYTIS